MSPMYEKVSALAVRESSKSVQEKIVKDAEIELIVNKTLTRKFSISPDSLKEFAMGYLLGEGLIRSLENVKDISIEENTIKVQVDMEDFDLVQELVVGSDCFGGWRQKIEFVDKVESEFTVDKKTLLKSFIKLKDNAFTWQETGGAHVAALIYKDKFLSREDVSRHVAVDKVIGAGLLEKVNFENSYIAYSGRMPADMLIKIARVGIPIIASNAAPTTSGYAVANEAGITMVGFVRGERFNIYTHPRRIVVD
ncbi:MAG: formate dehydrogenase accessory sulfurtransferase FdhD [Euryarchaeota archaeon]|nr:formate dehydrogenase accessory sulfurtransferase FdhD [Euryarchaeota archaeon]MBV1730191.1 formate dehydrogenase accessory sulfurtransferase FdhD [Methanobacterium sp.]MBU4547678.1 formate dehydrogenase accessory sulfurtransferase FdhD [Euryarchaeota archaeon]MBU4607106.1 formate dehydrogenase accessory sulfurtransferase FdhD [Euryarchaeota archaeon]MBV1754655.1 formate dehydrogenase accessory sulfurtransferase FdhD [Methanobacterium sp.]